MYLFLPLGEHPPANAFLRREQLDEPEARWDLNTFACLNCGLVQVPNRIPPDFFRHYLYVPSASPQLHDHFASLAGTLRDRFLAGDGGLLVDIGSNDGLFLGAAQKLGLRCLGIEPAANLAAIAEAKGLTILNEYFNPATARRAREAHGPARVIVTTNTFNHIDDLHVFLAGVSVLLTPEGTFVIEVPEAIDYVEHNEFDTVYHEHLSVFSVHSIAALLDAFDMCIVDLQRLELHGGSMRFYCQRRDRGGGPAPIVEEWLGRERRARLFDQATYDALAARVARLRDDLLSLIRRLRAEGSRVAGYGAPAKGNTLLNYCRLGPDSLDYLADRSSLKHGLYSPGMRIPIVPAERVFEDRPDYLLILAWNFADEIIRQQEAFRRAGGKFILPIPQPRIVE